MYAWLNLISEVTVFCELVSDVSYISYISFHDGGGGGMPWGLVALSPVFHDLNWIERSAM